MLAFALDAMARERLALFSTLCVALLSYDGPLIAGVYVPLCLRVVYDPSFFISVKLQNLLPAVVRLETFTMFAGTSFILTDVDYLYVAPCRQRQDNLRTVQAVRTMLRASLTRKNISTSNRAMHAKD